MAQNSGQNVSTSYEGLGYAFDKVVFQKGKPILDSELNLLQELQETLTQKSTGHLNSGWLSFRPYYTSRSIENAFYTQDPTGSKPEVALVNGWPVYVTNTNTPLKHVNKVSLNDNELRSGSRIDGVFLEVWRALISSESENTQLAKPQPITKISDLNGVFMYDENIGVAVGENGVILKTSDGGLNWTSVSSPINTTFKKVKFVDQYVGYAIGIDGNIIKTIDGGDSWFAIETTVTNSLNDLAVVSADQICVVGDDGTVLLSIDGVNFNVITQTSGVTANLNGVYFFDSAVGWAVGNAGTLIITKDGGNTWMKYTVRDLNTSTDVTADLYSVAFYNLNDGLIVGANGIILRSSDSGFTWVSMTDRIWNGGAYKALTDIFPTEQIDLKRVFIQNDFPVRFVVGVYPDSRNYFRGITYEISPATYPNSFVLRFTGTQDNRNYVHVLNLALYADAEALRDAINNIESPYLASDVALPDVDRDKVRVFEATITYEPFGAPSDFRPSSGSITGLRPAEISFSVEDKAWAIGNNGVILVTKNSGSKWEVLDLDVGYDLNDVNFVSSNVGWFVGSDGAIIKYDPANIPAGSEVQDSDLTLKSTGRIYPEGNIESEATNYLADNILDPQVNVETTKRVQIQYRIRVIDGVDPFNYPESGLGMPFVYSLGPNVSATEAGSYAFTNMGTENGDYGLWRSNCRNTYDGYSWAVPMFFVSRRNSAPFNVDSNINGSTYFNAGTIRPDGLLYQEIIEEDIIDTRRMVNVGSYSYLLEKNIDKLLGNRLATNLSDKDQQGLQYGTSILAVDTYQGTNAINDLVRGNVSSAAVIQQEQRVLDPNIIITESELTFGPIDNGLYHNDPSMYSALVVRVDDNNNQVVTNEPVSGAWEGLGTNKVKFNIDQNFTPAGGTLTNIQYQFTTHYMDYSRVGLSRVPNTPVSVKYVALPTDTSQVYYFNGINSTMDSKVLEYLTTNVEGYQDYTTLRSAKVVADNANDAALYELLGNTNPSDANYARSLRKYDGQQLLSSLVEYHYFTKVDASTRVLRIPKNLNGYSVFAVRSVNNVNGTVYRLSTDYANNQVMRDRETVDSVVVTTNLIVYLDEAFTIPAGVTLEIILDVLVPPNIVGGADPSIGITVVGRGETQEALRTSFVSNFFVASKSVEGMYVGVLYPVTFTNLVNAFTVDFASSTITGLRNATVMGLATTQAKDKSDQYYMWYKSNDPAQDYYTMAPVASLNGMGTSSITINVDPRKSINAGQALIPLLLRLDTLPALTDASLAYAFYKYRPYQTVGELPESLQLEIVKGSDFVYISNLGTGAVMNTPGVPYEIPLEHIAVNDDSVMNDNMFSNVDDLKFAGFSVDTGFVKLPAIISRYVGEDITLSSPNNAGDHLGRTYYAQCSEDFVSQTENLLIGNPRKVFIPMIGRVRTDVTFPFMRGELVLVVFTKVYKARLENKVGVYEDDDVEYAPGYTENAETAVSVYRLTNKPIVRK